MTRYFAWKRPVQPKGEWIDIDAPLVPSISVSDHQAADTGLVDVRGNSIMRAPNPIGFGRDDEW